jgi:RNA-directed DNA polymerase
LEHFALGTSPGLTDAERLRLFSGRGKAEIDSRAADCRSSQRHASRGFRARAHFRATDNQRPLGIAALEDKIVQRAMVDVLNAIYEEDFLGFSYGFPPGRVPHDALDALARHTTGVSERFQKPLL